MQLDSNYYRQSVTRRLVCMLGLRNRFQPRLLRHRPCKLLPPPSSSVKFVLRHTMASAALEPVSSTAKPAQLPALKGPHAGDKKPKEKKAKAAAASEHPLEVRCVVYFGIRV